MNNIEINTETPIIEIEVIENHTVADLQIEDGEEFDYEKQFNLPKINDVELKGNKTGYQLGLVDRDELAVIYSNINELKHDNEANITNNTLNSNQIDVLKEIVEENKLISDNNIENIAIETDTIKNNIDALTGDVENLSAEIDYKINRSEVEHLIANIQQFKHQKVDELPQVGSESILYLLPTNEGIYEEYIWIDSEQKYEDIGSTAIDLTGYAKLADLPKKISDLQNDSNYITHHQDISNLVTKSDLMVQLLQKADSDLLNVRASYDWVTSSITYNDGAGGYRKCRNKRLEQWGISTTSTHNAGTAIDLWQPFKNQNYNIQITVKALGNYFVCANTINNQRIMVRICDSWGTPQPVQFYWECKGYTT